MITTPILFLLPLVALSSGHPFLSCNCGLGPGEDVCDRCTPLVVRPVDVPKPILPTAKVVCAPVGGVPPLLPQDSPCDCRTSLVTPALVPRPPCTSCGCGGGIINDRRLLVNQREEILYGRGGSEVVIETNPVAPILIDEASGLTPANPANYVPADPVSLHVAYKLAQEKCHHDEDKISFGFRTLPKDIPLFVKKIASIPEGNLYGLNGQIVELKAKKCSNSKSLDEEAREQLDQLAEEEDDENLNENYGAPVKQISLAEIGYGPAKIQDPLFINVEPIAAAVDDGLSSAVSDCNDGFQPGNVVISQLHKPESLAFPPLLPPPCPPDDLCLSPPPVLTPGTVYGSPYTYLSSSSSAASNNLYKQSVILQKVGCGCS